MDHGRLGRREFLTAAATLAGAGTSAAAGRRVRAAAAADPPTTALIVRESSPPNLESSFDALDGPITPTNRFYVRSHFPTPKIDPSAWRLRVEGAVDRPLELSVGDLATLPSATRAVTMECAGNGRVYLTPKARGVMWSLGAVGNAEWSGVPLTSILERAGVRPGAVEVVLEGADSGEIRDDPKSPGVIHFARSVPLEKAARDVLLARSMNGRPLTTDHGAPLRAVVPGWYGMASIKWLSRIVVVDRPFRGFFQTFEYTTFDRHHGEPSMVPITEMRVKSSIARPVAGEVVAAGTPYRVSGAAWAGESDVARVDLSTDGGRSWSPARLLGPAVPHAWRLWEFTWDVPPAAGPATLMARATDSAGRAQPMTRDGDLRTYLIHHVLPVGVEVS